MLPQARRFPELGVTAAEPLPLLEPIGQLLRTPASAAGEEDARDPDASDARKA